MVGGGNKYYRNQRAGKLVNPKYPIVWHPRIVEEMVLEVVNALRCLSKSGDSEIVPMDWMATHVGRTRENRLIYLSMV